MPQDDAIDLGPIISVPARPHSRAQ